MVFSESVLVSASATCGKQPVEFSLVTSRCSEWLTLMLLDSPIHNTSPFSSLWRTNETRPSLVMKLKGFLDANSSETNKYSIDLALTLCAIRRHWRQAAFSFFNLFLKQLSESETWMFIIKDKSIHPWVSGMTTVKVKKGWSYENAKNIKWHLINSLFKYIRNFV